MTFFVLVTMSNPQHVPICLFNLFYENCLYVTLFLQVVEVLSKHAGLWITTNNDVFYSQATHITFICPMRFDSFPLDTQVRGHPQMTSLKFVLFSAARLIPNRQTFRYWGIITVVTKILTPSPPKSLGSFRVNLYISLTQTHTQIEVNNAFVFAEISPLTTKS
jgi:hypothetical protein